MFRRIILGAWCAGAMALGTCGCREQRVVLYPGDYDLGPAPLAEPVEVSVSFFYDRLAPYGTWVEIQPYGHVWSPAGVPVGWRPYTYGSWVYSEACGWLWVSSWPWGWAPFHYGRWLYDGGYGWVWIPGEQWGPAWVAWRWGGGYVGWAPLPPRAGWRAGRGLELRDADFDGIPDRDWVFVAQGHFAAPVHDYAILPERNLTVLRATHNVTRIVSDHDRVVDRSVRPEEIEKAAGRRVERWKVYDAPSVAAARLPHQREGVMGVFRPRVVAAPPSVIPPRQDDVERRHAIERAELQEKLQADRERLERQQAAERLQAEQQQAQRLSQAQRQAEQQRLETARRQREAERQQLERRLAV